MPSYNTSAATRKPPDITLPSTGTGPEGWRAYWREQSIIDRTDWVSIGTAVAAVMNRLAGSSSWCSL